MAQEENLSIILRLKDQASAALNGFKGKLEDMEPAFKKMAAGGTAAFAAVGAIAVTSLQAYAEAEADMIKATTTLQNTFDNLTKGEVQNLKKELGTTTVSFTQITDAMDAAGKAALGLAFDDEEASQAYAKLFQVTKSTEQANKELGIAMDLSRNKGISLTDAVKTLTLVHSGATKELKLQGLAVDENATALENIDAIGASVANNAANYAATTKGQMEALTNQIGNLREEIGGALAPALAAVVEKIRPVLDTVIVWVQENPKLTATILAVVAGVSALVAGIGLLGLALPGIIAAVTLLGTAIGLITLPLVLLTAAIVAIVAVVIWWATHWQENVETMKWAWDTFWNAVSGGINASLAFISGKISAFATSVTGIWNALWSSMASAATAAWEGVKSVITGSINYIIEKINKLINALNTVSSAGGKVIGSKDLGKIPNIPMLAAGGIVTKPTLAMIGEAGPEAVVPLSKGGGMGFGGGVTFNMYYPQFTSQEGIDLVRVQIEAALRDVIRINKLQTG